MQTLRAIIFDKDGTLFNFHATWAAWAADFLTDLSGGDTSRAQFLGDQLGFDMASQTYAPDSPVIAGTPEEIASHLLPHLPGMSAAHLVLHMNEAAACAPMKEAAPLIPLLDTLKARGLALGVATNDGEHPARAHLQSAGIEARFDFIAGCDSGFGAKPAPGQLQAFARHVSLPPSQITMVGDSRHDLLAGRAAGMTTVGVLTGLALAEDLHDLADAILPDIGHLPGWLDGASG